MVKWRVQKNNSVLYEGELFNWKAFELKERCSLQIFTDKTFQEVHNDPDYYFLSQKSIFMQGQVINLVGIGYYNTNDTKVRIMWCDHDLQLYETEAREPDFNHIGLKKNGQMDAKVRPQGEMEG